MKKILSLVLILCVYNYRVHATNLPGPLVYVVTPSPRPPQNVEGRSAPFFYHKWLSRMDSPQNISTITPTTTPKLKTPDLIFAEFESDNGDNMRKSLRKLLEKEKTALKTTTTTFRPIYVPDDEPSSNDYGLPSPIEEKKEIMTENNSDKTDYFAMYNNLYNNIPAPVYLPSTDSPITSTTSTTTTSNTKPPSSNVENIWHIIDSEKHDQYSGNWHEVSSVSHNQDTSENDATKFSQNEDGKIDDNFSLPGFGTNPGNGAENESRAIRTEPNIRFPYVNLKPFVMKNKPLFNSPSNNKKGNNMFMNLDNFQDIKNPVRGEAQDVVPMRQPIDRYNPAQPYLPHQSYNSKSKQSSPNSTPIKTVANLVPPPPPPPPKLTDNDFPFPTSYDSFPPYSSPNSDDGLAPAPVPPTPVLKPQVDTSDDSDSGPPSDDNSNDGPPIDLDYRYRPPSPPVQKFVPTLPPLSKPFKGYSYNKPSVDPPPQMDMDFKGYSYNKPADMPTQMDMGTKGYSYDKPPMTADLSPPPSMDNGHKPNVYGYHYKKPEIDLSIDNHSPSPSLHHDYQGEHDYPELVFNNHHGHGPMDDSKGTDDTKDNDMDMVPPPPPPDMMKPDMDAAPPMDDHGFPHDFPGDFKYHHDDFDDHDFYHHHHHPTTTTTTTTEMPRVNRYSYYYLGKKLYYLPLYFSVYFIVYVGALVIKAVLRHKIVYPNSWRPNDTTASFFSKRSVDAYLSNKNLHEITGKVTHALATAAEKYMKKDLKEE